MFSTFGLLFVFYAVISIVLTLFVLAACIVSSRASNTAEQLFQAAQLTEQEAVTATHLSVFSHPTTSHDTPLVLATHRNFAINGSENEQPTDEKLERKREVIESVLEVLNG